MALPHSARKRLAEPLRNAPDLHRSLREFHSVPVGQWAWGQHATALVGSLKDLAASIAPPVGDFDTVRHWVDRFLSARRHVLSHLLALEPFAPFDGGRAAEVLRLVDIATTTAAKAVDGSGPWVPPAQELRDAADWWAGRRGVSDGTEALRTAFVMAEAPVDEAGEFRADWVLQQYAYKTQDLLSDLIPHLASFGVPGVTDLLAIVSIVGWVLNCEDPVTAYVELDTFVHRYLEADPTVAAQVNTHLRVAEPALRRTRQAANRALVTASNESEDPESRAAALVDAYKRTVEGPFRQFSWAVYCLGNGAWEPPPMLTNLRDRLIAGGGNLGSIAGNVVIPALRNSETHETLTWDGFTDEFVTEDGRVSPGQVALALTLADSFVQGCEAGLACVRALDVNPDGSELPSPEEEGRMASWRRVQAFFGTNRLQLLNARLNTRHACMRVQDLDFTDINPCFQALVLSHRLLPAVETFSVTSSQVDDPLIVVSSGALDATMPVWEYVIGALDQIPLSTFLAVNFDARRRIESPPVAVRSVAWIAVDDALGAVDGSPRIWDENTRRLIETRLQVVEKAIEQTRLVLDGNGLRLDDVQASVRNLRGWIAEVDDSDTRGVERHPAVLRLRAQWRCWGPVARHPLIPDADSTDLPDREPRLRARPGSSHYRSL